MLAISAAMAVAVCALAEELPVPPPLTPCVSRQKTCPGSKADLKHAKAAFTRGLQLQQQNRTEPALEQFEIAANLVPQDVEYLTARELARQQAVSEHLQYGSRLLDQRRNVEALAEFHTALSLDPQSQFAIERSREAVGDWLPARSGPVHVVAAAGPIQIQPDEARPEFHYRGDSRGLLTQVAKAYGITVTFDDSVVARPLRFDLDGTDFTNAMQIASQITRTFWTSLDAHQILIAADTTENRKALEHIALRSFYIPGAGTQQELNDISNLLRSLFEVRFLSAQPAAHTLTVRAPERILRAVEEFMAGLDSNGGAPQVLLDIKVYEVDHSLIRKIGIQIPNQFTAINIPAAALAALGGQNIQDLINQLIASGGINQANSTAISALLAQLQGQQNSIFSTPVATFGGGKTLTGLTLGALTATLSLNESKVQTLEHLSLHAAQGNAATMHIGTRYPILNASFAPILNSPSLSQVIGNNSFQTPFPSFSYEDLGINVKAKPFIHGSGDISLDFELSLRALGAASLNGVPVISNRDYKGQMTLRDGEPAVIVGSLSSSEQKSASGFPLLTQIPGLRHATSTSNKQIDDNELLVVITPHILSQTNRENTREIWLSPTR